MQLNLVIESIILLLCFVLLQKKNLEAIKILFHSPMLRMAWTEHIANEKDLRKIRKKKKYLKFWW